MSTNPLVSIGVPTRNRAASLRRSLEGILAQDYSPIEVVISDNCSEDETERVCREIVAADARVRYVRQPRNIGLYGNHNFCMDAARGDFLCLFHDHDRQDSRIVSEYVSFMLAHPRVGIVCADWNLIDDHDVQVGIRALSRPPVTRGLDYITETIRSGRSAVGTPGLMVRREALGTARFGPEAPTHFGDFPLWFRIAEAWDIGHIPKLLWSWRQEAASQSAEPIHDMADDFEQNLGEYCTEHLERWPAHAELVDSWRASIRRYLFWALAYEVALHFRPPTRGDHQHQRTLFEIMDYRLTPAQLTDVLAGMKRHQSGVVMRSAYAVINAFVQVGLTGPLAWTIKHQSTLRSVLRLK